MHYEALLDRLKAAYPAPPRLAEEMNTDRTVIWRIYVGERRMSPSFLRRVRDRVPGFKQLAEMALYELVFGDNNGDSPADSPDSTKSPVAV